MANAVAMLENPAHIHPNSRSRRAMRDTSIRRLFPLLALVYACLLPQEVRVEISGQTIFAYRAVSLLLIPWLLRQLLRRTIRLNTLDLMLIVSGSWMIVSMFFVYGRWSATLSGIAVAIDLIIPYLVARISIQNLIDLRRCLVFIAPGLAVTAGLIFLESITHTPFVRRSTAAVFGNLPAFQNGVAVGQFSVNAEIRLGLMRAYGPFSHPILAGVFLASFLPLYFNSGLVRWPSWTGIASGFGAFFSLSSAALLGLLIFAILQFYFWLVERVKFITWRIFLVATSSLVVAMQVLTDNGVIPYLSQFTLTPGTAFYRRLIWRFGSESVAANPVIGIGFEGYQRLQWMPESVDAHWLWIAIRHGILPSVLLLTVAVATVYLLSVRSLNLGRKDRIACFGVISALVIIIIAGFTVSYFGAIGAWFPAVIGLGVSLAVNIQAGRRGPERVVWTTPDGYLRQM